jgi:hypothetical protein
VALGITVIFTQPLSNWLVVAPWLLLGALVYVAYARQGAVSVRQREALVSGIVLPTKKRNFRVMVALADPAKATALIRLGAQIAAAHDGLLLALQVSPAAGNDLPSKQQAQAAWQELNDTVRPLEAVQVPVTPLVRLAPSATEGILATIWEEKIDLVLLGWPATRSSEATKRDGTIGQIVRKAQCEVVILHGHWMDAVAKILVPVVSAGHSPAALRLGQDLRPSDKDESEIIALRVLPGKLTDKKRRQAEQQLQQSLGELQDPSGIRGEVMEASNSKEGILQIADQYGSSDATG